MIDQMGGPEKQLFDRTEVQRQMKEELTPLLEAAVSRHSIKEVVSLQEIDGIRAQIENEVGALVQAQFPKYTFEAVVADVTIDRDSRTLSIQFCSLVYSDKEEKSYDGPRKIPDLTYAQLRNIDRSKVTKTGLEQVADGLQTDIDQLIGKPNDLSLSSRTVDELLKLELSGQVFEGPMKNMVIAGTGGSVSDGKWASYGARIETGIRTLSTDGFKDPRTRVIFGTRIEARRG
jgi:hypothetical protein